MYQIVDDDCSGHQCRDMVYGQYESAGCQYREGIGSEQLFVLFYVWKCDLMVHLEEHLNLKSEGQKLTDFIYHNYAHKEY